MNEHEQISFIFVRFIYGHTYFLLKKVQIDLVPKECLSFIVCGDMINTPHWIRGILTSQLLGSD